MTFFQAQRENGFQLVRRLIDLDAVGPRGTIWSSPAKVVSTAPRSLGKAPAQLGELAHKFEASHLGSSVAGSLCPHHAPPSTASVALSTKENPGPPPDSLTSAQHAQRLEQLADEAARSYLRESNVATTGA